MRSLAALAVTVALVASGCTTLSGAAGGERARVVATTPVLAELAHGVLGDDVAVETLIPAGVDPHQFRFTELHFDVASDADLLVVGGPALEQGFDELVAHAEGGPEVFVAAEHPDEPLTELDGAVDPHFWHDPTEMGQVARALADRVEDVEALDVERPKRAAHDYARSLQDLRFEMEELLQAVPESRRGLVTQHDFLRYFARAFEFRIVGTVVPGLSSTGQPSSGERLALLETMGSEVVCVLFTSEGSGETLSEVVAREAERPVEVTPLFADTLPPDMDYAETLVENARRLTKALTGCT